MDEKQQSSVQQELERLFPSQRGGGMGGERRELHMVGAFESSASATTDTNTSFATPSTAKWTIAEIWGSKTCGTPSKFAIFFHVKHNDSDSLLGSCLFSSLVFHDC